MNLDISRVNLSEADIEKCLYENPKYVVGFSLNDNRSLRVVRWMHRQFSVPSGVIDLLGELDNGGIAVVEVKLGAIDGRAIAQVRRYAKDITNAFSALGDDHDIVPVYTFVVGSSLEERSLFECYAIGVIPIIFSPRLSLTTNNPNWSSSYILALEQKYSVLVNDAELLGIQSAWESRGKTEDNALETINALSVEDSEELCDG